MFFITTVRIIGWYTPGILKMPLLWSLFVALIFIDLGFLLFAAQGWMSISPYLATHTFAVGGIGFMTMRMMARASIGHTGRSLKTLPRLLPCCLGLLLLGATIRVILPIMFGQYYSLWISLSGICWVIAFILFAYAFLPILSRPRPDQKDG
jgi:uncharacterized protein involved in response to NO